MNHFALLLESPPKPAVRLFWKKIWRRAIVNEASGDRNGSAAASAIFGMLKTQPDILQKPIRSPLQLLKAILSAMCPSGTVLVYWMLFLAAASATIMEKNDWATKMSIAIALVAGTLFALHRLLYVVRKLNQEYLFSEFFDQSSLQLRRWWRKQQRNCAAKKEQ